MDRKKKIVIKFILLAFIFSLIFFFFKIGYKYYDDFVIFGKNYLGIFFVPVIAIIFLDIFFTFINSKKKRILYKTRLLFSVVLTISVSSVSILGTLKYFKKLDETNIIDMCIMKYDFGFLMTYFITYIWNKFKLNHIFAAFSVLIFISLFFLVGKEIGRTVRYFIKCKRKREAIKLEKALLAQMQTQIAIKETLEEKKAVEYEKQNIILDTVIKEKVEKAIEKDILPLDIDVVKESTEEEKEEDTLK